MIIHGRSKDWLNLKSYLEKQIPNTSILVTEEEFVLGKISPEKFEYLASKVDYAVAIATPDDIGGLKNAKEIKPCARQNVLDRSRMVLGLSR